ncbi:MAG: chloride channel protein, partial [Methyloligellaceae bacterium]
MADAPRPGKEDTQQGPAPATKMHEQKSGIMRSIEWLLHLVTDRMIPNLREFLGERQPLVWLIALAIGIGAAYFAIFFRTLIGLVQLPWLGTLNEDVYSAAANTPWWVILLAPAVGGLAVGLFLHHVMPGRRVHGVADVIEARALLGCRIDARVGLSSALLSAVSLGAGASAGREGPVVHLGATLASVLVDVFRLSHAARRTLL